MKKTPYKKSPHPNVIIKQKQHSGISAHDIITGLVEINADDIPQYLAILDDYENECSMEARYYEAIVAKNKKEELKKIMKKVKRERTLNQHLKEKVQVEEAYLQEFNEF